MKTSNKILTASILIILGYLMIYNLALKAEYVKGDYKKPHYHMQQLSFSNFNVIENNAGNIIGIQVEKGPYGVWVDNSIKDKVKISQQGQTLQIAYVSNEDIRDYKGIIINCPDLVSLTTNPFINPKIINNNRYIRQNGNSMIIDYYPHGTSTVTGFDQPAMSVQANEYTEIEMENNTLDQLNAVVGDSKKGKAGVTIKADNKITAADLQVPGKSMLTLDNVAINKVTYKIADRAQITLTGRAAHLLDHN